MFLIPGPLLLRGQAGDVPLGGARARRLLAALAVRAGKRVPADQLIEGVRGEAPPRSARRNLCTCLWALRAVSVRPADVRRIFCLSS